MRTFINAHHEQLRFNHSSGTWLVWSDHYWRPDERKLAFSWSLELCRELARTIDGKDATKGRLVVEKVRFSAAVEQGARTMPKSPPHKATGMPTKCCSARQAASST